MKTSELTGAALDWAVAKCEGLIDDCYTWLYEATLAEVEGGSYHPATDWAQGGPIIEQGGISVLRCDDTYGTDATGFCNNQRIPKWAATTGQHGCSEVYGPQGDYYGKDYEVDGDSITGPTPLIAAMRCYVASKLGDTVDVPQELTNN